MAGVALMEPSLPEPEDITKEIVPMFPEDVTNEIFARLPVKTFLRPLCKAMRNLADDPNFVNKHLKFSSQRNPNLILTDVICRGKGYFLNTLYFVQNEETPNRYSCNKLSLKIPEFRVMNSCNGLICLLNPKKRYEICICNPCTGKLIEIPPPVRMQDIPGNIVVGFGLGPLSNKYKVVAIIEFLEDSHFGVLQKKVFVYTLGHSTWRCKSDTSGLRLGQSACKAFVNGALHWVDYRKRIVSFNIDTEELDFIQCPELELGCESFSLRAFKGKLLILNTSFADRIDIWVMNNYRDGGSWSRVFTIDDQNIGRNISQVEIVCFLEDWEVYMVYDHGALLRYNLETKSVIELIGIDGLPKRFDVVAHVGTLVSPLPGRV